MYPIPHGIWQTYPLSWCSTLQVIYFINYLITHLLFILHITQRSSTQVQNSLTYKFPQLKFTTFNTQGRISHLDLTQLRFTIIQYTREGCYILPPLNFTLSSVYHCIKFSFKVSWFMNQHLSWLCHLMQFFLMYIGHKECSQNLSFHSYISIKECSENLSFHSYIGLKYCSPFIATCNIFFFKPFVRIYRCKNLTMINIIIYYLILLMQLFYMKNACSLLAFFQALVFLSNTCLLQSLCIQYSSQHIFHINMLVRS